MSREEIMYVLEDYLTQTQCIELTLSLAIPGINICLTIARIAEEYNATQKEEDIVCDLLAKLCKIHFDTPNN